MTRATWLPEVLRDAGLKVETVPGWHRRGTTFPGLRSVVLHHDGSPAGNSPGIPAYMAREIDAGRAGAQLWVNRAGVWYVIASGVVYHAGKVRPGMPGNGQSLGVETDHTIGERWPAAQLSSLRHGSAAILRRLGKDASELHMHKTICAPPGRKTDPDGLDLATERGHVAVLMTRKPPAPKQEEDVMASLEEVRAVVRDEINRLSGGPRRRDGEGNVIDSDPQTISIADTYTLLETLRGEVAQLRAEVKR